MKDTPSQTKKELKKAYEQIATQFSESRSKAWPEFEMVEKSLENHSKVLDLGCGNGRLYDYLSNTRKLEIDYTGIDFCAPFLDIARDRYPQASFVEADISHFDLDMHFDAIISIAAFHHLPSQRMRKQCLKHIFEHLEDDGILILSVWNLWQKKYFRLHLYAFWEWIRSGFKKDRKGLMVPFGKEKVLRYYHAFHQRELRSLLKKNGFQIDHFEVNRHNYFFIAHKHLVKAQSQPINTLHRKPSPAMNTSPAATCHQ